MAGFALRVAFLELLVASTLHASSLPVASCGLFIAIEGLTAAVEAVLQRPRLAPGLRTMLEESLRRRDLIVLPFSAADALGFVGTQRPTEATSWGLFVPHQTIPRFTFSDGSVLGTFRESRFRYAILLDPSHPTVLSTLVHELAHERFFAFFQRMLPTLARRFPSFVEAVSDDRYVVDWALFFYLTERYAHQQQLALYVATEGAVGDDWIRCPEGRDVVLPKDFARILRRKFFLRHSMWSPVQVLVDHWGDAPLSLPLLRGEDADLLEHLERLAANRAAFLGSDTR